VSVEQKEESDTHYIQFFTSKKTMLHINETLITLLKPLPLHSLGLIKMNLMCSCL